MEKQLYWPVRGAARGWCVTIPVEDGGTWTPWAGGRIRALPVQSSQINYLRSLVENSALLFYFY